MAAVALLAAAEAAETGTMPELTEALDSLRVAITLFDSAERLTWCNQHFNYLFRSMPPREELVGKTHADLIRLEVEGGEIAPLDGDIETFVARRRTQFKEGEYRPRDIQLADGRIVEIKARCTATGGWIALWTDVTHARHSFMRQEDLVELSADAFAFWDRNDRLLMCNAAFAEIHGTSEFSQQATFEQVVRNAIAQGCFVADEDAEAWIQRRLEAHRMPAGAFTVRTPTGAAYLVRDRATRDGGRATVLTDATEHHRAEAALGEQKQALARTKRALAKSQVQATRQASYLADLTRRLDAAAAEADTAKTTLLRTMSHELKTPLNAIIGFSDLLQMVPDQFSKQQVGEYAGLIHTAGKNLLKLINQILDLTKIAARRFPLQPANIAAGGALWMATDTVRAKAEQKEIELAIGECEPDLMVTVDENAFGSIVGQLVDNAVNFTQQGGRVCLSAVRASNGTVRVVVSDNGPGVAPEDIARIMEPFEQAARGISDHAQGAGLGLPLAKALAELHGGTLAITSTLGHGFTATVELPLG